MLAMNNSKKVSNIVSEKVVALIEQRGISRKEIIDVIGIEKGNLSKVYNKKGSFTWEQLKALQVELGIPCSKVIADEFNRSVKVMNTIAKVHKTLGDKYKTSL